MRRGALIDKGLDISIYKNHKNDHAESNWNRWNSFAAGLLVDLAPTPYTPNPKHAVLRLFPLQLFLLLDQFQHAVPHLDDYFSFGQTQSPFVTDVIDATFALAVLTPGASYLYI